MSLVLLCEPNYHTAGPLTQVLEGEGFEVIEARDLESARFQIIMKSPDFILIDWLEFDIQNMDIKDFCQQTKRIRPHTIFIFMSHKGLKTDLLDFEKMIADNGADGYILKPFNLSKVLEQLKSWQPQG